jgi:hypothetical protein
MTSQSPISLLSLGSQSLKANFGTIVRNRPPQFQFTVFPIVCKYLKFDAVQFEPLSAWLTAKNCSSRCPIRQYSCRYRVTGTKNRIITPLRSPAIPQKAYLSGDWLTNPPLKDWWHVCWELISWQITLQVPPEHTSSDTGIRRCCAWNARNKFTHSHPFYQLQWCSQSCQEP